MSSGRQPRLNDAARPKTLGEMRKGERERAILRMVYQESEFDSVRHQDCPDFVLSRNRTDAEFGVEVTELYQTESDARVMNKPRYVSDLLDGASHMHKDDVKTLDVATVTIHDSNGNLKAEGVPAIIRQRPSREEHSQAVASTIRRKNEKAATYSAGLAHINLIIVDRFGFPLEKDAEYLATQFLVPELRTALVQAPFREVFLVSETSGDAPVYRPLQALLLLESFSLFLGAVGSFVSDTIEVSNLLSLFIHTMQGLGLHVALGRDFSGTACAVYRGVGVRHTNGGIQALDFHDYRPPAPLPLPPRGLRAEAMAEFQAHHAAFSQENGFVTGLAIDVVESVPF
jgi:hypothetical protein